MLRSVSIAALLVLIGSRSAAGDDNPAATSIATDRPAVSASSIVVPFGTLQAENGTTRTSSQGQHTWDGPETSLRFGMTSRTELRLTAPNVVGPVATGSGSGVADLAVGLKQQLGPVVGGVDVSLVVSLSLPTGTTAVSSHGYDPSVQLPWSRVLWPNWTAAGMLSLYAPTEAGRHNLTGEATFLMDRQWTARWDGFVEYVGDFPQVGGARNLVHVGTGYKPTPHQQFDVHVGVGLSSAAADYLIGIGYSFRVRAVGQ
jgi:hypothetical protein